MQGTIHPIATIGTAMATGTRMRTLTRRHIYIQVSDTATSTAKSFGKCTLFFLNHGKNDFIDSTRFEWLHTITVVAVVSKIVASTILIC